MGFEKNHVEVIHKRRQYIYFVQDSNGRTALHKGSRKDLPEIVSKLLSHSGIDVNPVDTEGLTPLMEAAKFGKFESLKVCLHFTQLKIQ